MNGASLRDKGSWNGCQAQNVLEGDWHCVVRLHSVLFYHVVFGAVLLGGLALTVWAWQFSGFCFQRLREQACAITSSADVF